MSQLRIMLHANVFLMSVSIWFSASFDWWLLTDVCSVGLRIHTHTHTHTYICIKFRRWVSRETQLTENLFLKRWFCYELLYLDVITSNLISYLLQFNALQQNVHYNLKYHNQKHSTGMCHVILTNFYFRRKKKITKIQITDSPKKLFCNKLIFS